MTTSNLIEPPRYVAPRTRFELQEKVILLVLTLRAPGNQRTVRDKSILATNAALARLHVGKTLIERDEYKAISILDGQLRDWVARLALPSPFKAGTHLIALGLLDAIENGLQTYLAKRAELVEAYIAVYEEAKAEARRQLGELYTESEYLTVEELRAAYSLSWQYVTLAPPDQLKALNAEIFERERERLQTQWDDAIDTMRDALRAGLAELVNDMVTRLDGDEKKFKPTKLLERFNEFLGTFDARNVTSDEELQALATQARALLAGVDTDAIKSSRELRERVRGGFKQAQVTLGEMETAGKRQRRITFEEE